MMQFTDVHAHLETLKDLNIILLRAKEAGVSKIITCGSSLEWSRKCVELAENGSNLVEIFACCGIHPQDGKEEIDHFNNVIQGSEARFAGEASRATPESEIDSGQARMTKVIDRCIDELRKLAKSKKVVAIGECGLDYGVISSKLQVITDKKFQEQLFISQIKLAADLMLPIVVHCRNAWNDLLTILESHNKYLIKPGMFHSWTGTLADARRAIKLGFYISFSGIITFKNAGEIVDVAKWAPMDRILVETDSPFLTPIPLRGKQNEPKNVKMTAQFLADIRGETLEKIAEVTSENAKRLFQFV